MKLPNAAADFLVLRLNTESGACSDTDTEAELESGHGAELPAIEAGKWIPAVAVVTVDPGLVTLDQLRGGDWLHITDVDGDTLTFKRTATARDLENGEYLFVSLSAYHMQILMEKIEDLEYMVGRIKGGWDGVPQWGVDGAPDALKAVEDDTPAMRVKVNAGTAFIGGEIVRLRTAQVSGTIVAPATNNRIDLVQAVIGTGGDRDGINVKTGVEDPSPEAPEPDEGALALATILLTPSHTAIETADITDVRERI